MYFNAELDVSYASHHTFSYRTSSSVVKCVGIQCLSPLFVLYKSFQKRSLIVEFLNIFDVRNRVRMRVCQPMSMASLSQFTKRRHFLDSWCQEKLCRSVYEPYVDRSHALCASCLTVTFFSKLIFFTETPCWHRHLVWLSKCLFHQ